MVSGAMIFPPRYAGRFFAVDFDGTFVLKQVREDPHTQVE